VPKPAAQPSLSIDDLDGRRLYLVWSRSGKRLGITVTTTAFNPFAQVGLNADQVDALAQFLSLGPSEHMHHGTRPRDAMQLDDSDDATATLTLAWTRPRNRLAVSAKPLRHGPPSQVHEPQQAHIDLRPVGAPAVH
jgi:hypothetical protein